MLRPILASLALGSALLSAQTTGVQKRWWHHVEVMADDKLEGRDTGSEGYRTAARYVVQQFERAGLKPAGENGYFQSVPLRQWTIDPKTAAIEIVRAAGAVPLNFNEQIGVTASASLPPKIDGALYFAGYGTEPADFEGADLKGKVVVVLAGTGRGAPNRGRLLEGAAALVSIDNPRALEAPRWPIAYAKSMAVEGGPARAATPVPTLRFNPAEAEILFNGSGHTFAEILAAAGDRKPLPHFAIPASLKVRWQLESAALKSDNLVAVLPGSDPALAKEYLVVSAHLDGYGIGTPVNGDAIYNGAFDDAACVADLLELAWDWKRAGKAPRRSVVFAVFTGEEKGLLGSQYFTSHFSVPKEQIVADINLDYIRPIFPLRILTTLGLTESTLGDAARAVAEPLGIRIQPDNEPERGLYLRSDQVNFIRNGIPGIAFIFGYEPGSKEEQIYRAWYRDRYHKPADDLKQPVDFDAAEKFYTFFRGLAERVAGDTARPQMRKSPETR